MKADCVREGCGGRLCVVGVVRKNESIILQKGMTICRKDSAQKTSLLHSSLKETAGLWNSKGLSIELGMKQSRFSSSVFIKHVNCNYVL